jgi:hypothetical protein
MTGTQLRRHRKERAMTLFGRSSRWVVALALGLAALIGVGAAMVPAAPARTAASAFELTLEESLEFNEEVAVKYLGTFRSQAPFCATGVVDPADPLLGSAGSVLRLACDDGAGSLMVSIVPAEVHGASWNTTWRILDGSGSYAGLRGKGSLRGEVLRSDQWGGTWRATFQGIVDRDAVAPTIRLSSATATKLRRPAGTYALKLGIAVRDNVADNPVSYTVRASGPGGRELARSTGIARTEAVSIKLRVRPLVKSRIVRLQISAEDPVGNQVSIWPRDLRLPR